MDMGMCGCVFFFFKQKTAYDVRISDWSSDVCSSDLAMQNRPGIRGLIEAALDGVFTRIITEDLSRLSRDQGDIAHFYKKLLFLGIGQIGRASGRERVCQYV